MMIHTIVKFDAAHRLYEYPGNCQQLHGHSFRAEVWIEGFKLDRFGLIVDFRDIKEKIKANLDHVCILNKIDPLCELLMLKTKVVRTDSNPSAETLAVYVLDLLRSEMDVKKVRVYESEHSYAEVTN